MIGQQAASARLKIAAAGVLFAAAAAILLVILVRQPLTSMDFRYIWLAGELWERGANPYGPEYMQAGAVVFPTGFAISPWAYPFHWWAPARLASVLAPEPAFGLWVAVTTVLLAGAAVLVCRSARKVGARLTPTATLLIGAYALSTTMVSYVLRTGQPALMAQCGIALMIYGVLTERRAITVVGIVLAMLKPQLGLPFVTALCILPGGLLLAIAGAAGVLLACVPAFLQSGAEAQVRGLLVASQSAYQQISYNTAEAMAGLPHLVHLATGRDLSILLSMLLAAVLTAAAAVAVRRRARGERKLLYVVLTTAITGTVVGLHTYDLAILLALLPFVSLLAPAQRGVVAIGFVLLWRPENVARLLGSTGFIPTLQTAGAALLLASWLWFAWSREASSRAVQDR
jgi:hypothetical protein